MRPNRTARARREHRSAVPRDGDTGFIVMLPQLVPDVVPNAGDSSRQTSVASRSPDATHAFRAPLCVLHRARVMRPAHSGARAGLESCWTLTRSHTGADRLACAMRPPDRRFPRRAPAPRCQNRTPRTPSSRSTTVSSPSSGEWLAHAGSEGLDGNQTRSCGPRSFALSVARACFCINVRLPQAPAMFAQCSSVAPRANALTSAGDARAVADITADPRADDADVHCVGPGAARRCAGAVLWRSSSLAAARRPHQCVSTS